MKKLTETKQLIKRTIPLILLLLLTNVSISQVIICGKIENVPEGSSVRLTPDWNGIAQGASSGFDSVGNFFIKLNKTDEKTTWTLNIGKKSISYFQLNDKDSIYITGDLQHNDSSFFELSKNTTFFAAGKGSSKINYAIANSTMIFHASDMSILNEEQMIDFAENFKNQCLLFLTTIKTKKTISEKLNFNDNMRDYYNELFLNGSITGKEIEFIKNTIEVNELSQILFTLTTYDGIKPHSSDTLKISLKNNYFNYLLNL